MLSILRIMAGLLFMEHGLGKLFGWPSADIRPDVLTLLWFGGVIECFGGAMIALGLLTRYVAFLASGEMALGYFMLHAPEGFFPLVNGGDAAILYSFLFLYFVFAGGGAWSLDRFWGLAGEDRDMARAGV